MPIPPDAASAHPMPGFPQVCFIRNTVQAPNIEIGEYTYYDDPDDSEDFARNVLYHFDFVGDRLRIGRYCAIARGVRFIMNGANHLMSGFSTYPFWIFGGAWASSAPPADAFPYKGDTVVGDDVWLGHGALVMPGVTIGAGAIVAAASVVGADVPPYAIVAGNPARVVRMRFDEDTVAALLDVAWWDWPVDKVTRNLPAILGADLVALRAAV